jgi:prepilin-type processing-associated H-X9-DG protein
MPAMQNSAVFALAVQPYVNDGRYFVCPVTNLPYTPNAALSGVTLATIMDFGTTIAVQDAQPHPDGKTTIAYMDDVVTQGGIDPNANTDCPLFVKELMEGISSYTQDYDEVLPPMQTTAIAQSVLMPYIHDSRVFACPVTGLPYAFNAALSGINLGTIQDTGTAFLVQDAQPHPDKRSAVGYMDGHILYGGVPQPNTETACDTSLKQLTLGVLLYAEDHDETLPPMKSFRQFWDAVYPYVGSSWRFHCPATHTYYVLNPKLSGVSLLTIADPSATVMIRDAKPHPNKTTAFGYVDGHVVRR